MSRQKSLGKITQNLIIRVFEIYKGINVVVKSDLL